MARSSQLFSPRPLAVSLSRFSCALAMTLALGGAGRAADGIWNTDAAGLWGGSLNWKDGIIADGVGSSADFSLANLLGPRRLITLDSSRTVGSLLVGDPLGSAATGYTFAATDGASLTFESGAGANASLTQSAVGLATVFSAPILLASALDFTNLAPLVNIVLGGALGGPGNLNITSGSLPVATTAAPAFSGAVELRGANPAFTGNFNVAGGALLMGNDGA